MLFSSLLLTLASSMLAPAHADSVKTPLPPMPLAGSAISADSEPDYDRLDGHGKSGKKVNVVEWEGNLEIHVYPAGSLKGLALKLDKKNKDKPVMVISYRFSDSPKESLIRRAILGIPLPENFLTYRDLSADDYDKIIITGNGLAASKTIQTYALEPPPTQLYPDGHPMLAEKKDIPSAVREPSSKRNDEATGSIDTESGTIKPFRW